MNTILYNIIENKVLGFYENGYIVDGKPSETFNNNIVELAVIEIEIPEYNPEMQSITSDWEIDLVAKTYTRTYEVHNQSAYEIAMEDWIHTNYLKRIIAPMELIMDDIGIKMYGWFQINNFPVLTREPYVYLYCNTILPQHQFVINTLGGVLTIEDRPEPPVEEPGEPPIYT